MEKINLYLETFKSQLGLYNPPMVQDADYKFNLDNDVKLESNLAYIAKVVGVNFDIADFEKRLIDIIDRVLDEAKRVEELQQMRDRLKAPLCRQAV